jgi:hypothetical protein
MAGKFGIDALELGRRTRHPARGLKQPNRNNSLRVEIKPSMSCRHCRQTAAYVCRERGRGPNCQRRVERASSGSRRRSLRFSQIPGLQPYLTHLLHFARGDVA